MSDLEKEIIFKNRYTPTELDNELRYCFYKEIVKGWRVYAGIDGEEHLLRKNGNRIYRYALFQRDPSDENPKWICKNLSWNNTFYDIIPWLKSQGIQYSIQPITHYEPQFTRLGKKLVGVGDTRTYPIILTRKFPESPFYHVEPKADIR